MATAAVTPNPTGAIGMGGLTGTATQTGGAGNYNFGNAANPNPTVKTDNPFAGANPQHPWMTSSFSSAPTTSMNPGGSPPSGNAFSMSGRGNDRTLSELQKYYGEGMGSMLFNFLQSGGGFNSGLTSQAVDAQVAAMQHQIDREFGNLSTNMAEQGVSPNSSSWALEAGDFYSNAVAQENAITAQEYFDMWNQSQNRMTSVLEKTADVNAAGTANEPGILDFLNMGLQIGGDVAGLFMGA